MSDQRRYEKLPGRTSHIVGVARLWVHPDHLLATTNYFGFERYQRYYFRDIQALLIRRTKGRLWWNLGFGACAAVCGLSGWGLWLAAPEEAASLQSPLGVFASIFGTVAAFFLLCLLINSLRGATCTLVAQTVTGAHSLPGTSRVRPARRVLARIAPRILEAQSGAPASETPA